jgi:hypothetical protein
MARRVFFSFHYQRDIWRVNQIRSIPNVTGCASAGFQDASIWEDAKKKGDAAIKALINKGLENTSVCMMFWPEIQRGQRWQCQSHGTQLVLPWNVLGPNH